MPPSHLPLPKNFAGFGPKIAKTLSVVVSDYQQFASEPDAVIASDPEFAFGVQFHGEVRHAQEAIGQKLKCTLVCTFPDTTGHCYNVAVRCRLLRASQPVLTAVNSAITGHTFAKDSARWTYTVHAAHAAPVVNNTVTVEFELRQGIPFRKPWRDFTRRYSARDVCITVSGSPDRAFYADPDFMAHVSPYFNRSLYPDVGGSAVDFQLDDVDPTDLEILLKALHDVCDPVNADNVEVLMSLSSRFEVLTLRAKCEKFLMQDTSFPLPRKLMIADRTSTVLRRHFVAKLTTYDIKSLNGQMPGLSSEGYAEVLVKAAEVHAEHRTFRTLRVPHLGL